MTKKQKTELGNILNEIAAGQEYIMRHETVVCRKRQTAGAGREDFTRLVDDTVLAIVPKDSSNVISRIDKGLVMLRSFLENN